MFGTPNLQIYDQPISTNNNKLNLVERIKENVLNNYNYSSKNSFKWTNNFVYNTTLYSGVDRRSTFYTDPDSVANDEVNIKICKFFSKYLSIDYCFTEIIVSHDLVLHKLPKFFSFTWYMHCSSFILHALSVKMINPTAIRLDNYPCISTNHFVIYKHLSIALLKINISLLLALPFYSRCLRRCSGRIFNVYAR